MLGRSVTSGSKSVEKRPQQGNFFELTTPNMYAIPNNPVLRSTEPVVLERSISSCEWRLYDCIVFELLYFEYFGLFEDRKSAAICIRQGRLWSFIFTYSLFKTHSWKCYCLQHAISWARYPLHIWVHFLFQLPTKLFKHSNKALKFKHFC